MIPHSLSSSDQPYIGCKFILICLNKKVCLLVVIIYILFHPFSLRIIDSFTKHIYFPYLVRLSILCATIYIWFLSSFILHCTVFVISFFAVVALNVYCIIFVQSVRKIHVKFLASLRVPMSRQLTSRFRYIPAELQF